MVLTGSEPVGAACSQLHDPLELLLPHCALPPLLGGDCLHAGSVGSSETPFRKGSTGLSQLVPAGLSESARCIHPFLCISKKIKYPLLTNGASCCVTTELSPRQHEASKRMEKSRSWPSAHDWKSCIPQKGIEGSNPSFSAILNLSEFSEGFFFCSI